MEMRKSKIAYIFLLIAIVVFLYFFLVVREGEPLLFDSTISSYLTHFFTESSYPFFKLFNVLGSTIGTGIISLFVIGLLWVIKRDYAGMALLALAISLGNLLNMWLKEIVGRPRPEVEHLVNVKSFSFPSGHAMMGMILYMLIAYFIMNNVRSNVTKWFVVIMAGMMILFMGISRIVLQVHYPSDVAAGLALGFIWTFIWITLYEIVKGKLKRR
ncbi:phosphatase PAP2 family protein [Cytobacillus dafuensis]|uniref:Phosphatase PAP2 family protein n=1 Tax=Cytobacillus dafuensis TaxID=1742359 RepID=A0A5B8Z2N0_CYTDA|nr:phosphatase PAP2 family protein [Cytobacillus dafuensis]QED47141.1 phosphatase PAP2 family protein [Cytobacillus dafuensis]